MRDNPNLPPDTHHERRTWLPIGDPRNPMTGVKPMPEMTIEDLNRRFKIVPTSLFTLPRDLSKTPGGQPLEGDCQDYAKTVRRILKVKPWQAIVWRCWSPQNGLLPRHAVIWVKGYGWVDSTRREWRDSPTPHRRCWPVGAPAIAFVIWQIGLYLGWWWL